MSSYKLHDLNQMSEEDFIKSLAWIFEDSPWVASSVSAERPFSSREALTTAMCASVEAAGDEVKRKLIIAHPDLGTRATMADASVKEQQGAGLSSLSPSEYQELIQLNERYKAKFHFPFILAVKGKTKADIFASLRERLDNDVAKEFTRALGEIYQIARFRLGDAVLEDTRA
ncbi:MAG: 2-oxo-4-hydroxy-4-carboxy-5-ureidoimidazoline decarboxylase [Deinococcales bacterium]